ncbi:MAG: YebC/PmpR family DNA-binding transcriptional regulator [Candidatus Pacebacteria bacterium]|nr:YebC/PmpR family DNA-binding transcriptional regulator [Candidatus Paceibacterota bacterium]
MSGHSHWSSIKRGKEIEDKKRGKIFSKLSKIITLSAREKGGNPDANPKLRIAIEKAKEANMPKDNIERAVKRGTGELAGEKLEEFIFEAYGPSGIAVIIEGITDNRKRALGDIKQILNQYSGKLANEGSVKWLFERQGVLEIVKGENNSKEELELKAIEAGALDFFWHDEVLEIYTKPEELENVKKNLEESKLKIESASLGWIPKEKIKIEGKDKETSEKLFEALDENEDVQEIYSNLL